MLEFYKTVGGCGEAEVVIKKSRFIGHAKPVHSDEEAAGFIEEIKKKHAQATHNCSAYLAGEHDEFQKQSDDGEPSGTAGKPILEVIKAQELKNTAIVVTRYFGGIMLGAGGLIRAYAEGASAAVAAARPVYKVLHQAVEARMDYTWYGKLENELRNRKIWMKDTAFTDKIKVTCMPRHDRAEAFSAWLTDFTQGQAEIRLGEAEYREQEEKPD